MTITKKKTSTKTIIIHNRKETLEQQLKITLSIEDVVAATFY